MMNARPRRPKKPITFGNAPQARTAALRLPRVSDDVRLFAVTFVGGFLFTALFIA